MRNFHFLLLLTCISLVAGCSTPRQIPTTQAPETLITKEALEVTRPSPDAQTLFQSGQVKIRANDFSGARTDFEKSVALDPENEKVLNALGMLYLQTAEGDLAIRTYGRSCAITKAKYGQNSSRLFGCQSLLGNAYLSVRNLKDAETSFRSAYEIAFAQSPRSTEDCLIALYYVAKALHEGGRAIESASLFDHLLINTPKTNRRYPEIEDALRRVRAGQMPQRLLR